MAENLYSLVSKLTNTTDRSDKVQLGYSVDSYAGVLAALQKAKQNIIQQMTGETVMDSLGNEVQQPMYTRWTELNAIKIGGVVNDDGFVVSTEDGGPNYETYRQQMAVLYPYMSFPIETKSNEDTETSLYYVPFHSNNTSVDSGTTVYCKQQYPIPDISKDYCDACGVGLGSLENPFQVGIGVDLTQGGATDMFFQKCYSKIYQPGCSKKLAELGALLAEVSFPDNAQEAKSVQIRVLVDSGKCPDGRMVGVHFPVPLLLTDQFKSLGKVYINDGQQKVVGEANCIYPLASSRYNHEQGIIENFTPYYIKKIISKDGKILYTQNGSICEVKYNGLQNGTSVCCYVRFYLDYRKTKEIATVFPQIPDDYKSQLFKGVGDVKVNEEVVGYTTGTTSQVFTIDAGELTEFFDKVGRELIPQMEGAKLYKAFETVGKFESGGNWGLWEVCGAKKGSTAIGDRQGISAGFFQFTQASGGLKKYRKYCTNMSAAMAKAIDESKVGAPVLYSQFKDLLPFASEFAQQASTTEGKLAQCKLWYEAYFLPFTKRACIAVAASNSAEFAAVYGACIHRPVAYKLYAQYADEAKKRSGYDKIVFLENIHWVSVLRGKGIKTATPFVSESEMAAAILNCSSSFGKGWSNRYKESLRLYKGLMD